eukprot:4366427-Alexandrium_andersonii.AAC.1
MDRRVAPALQTAPSQLVLDRARAAARGYHRGRRPARCRALSPRRGALCHVRRCRPVRFPQ